MHSVILIHGLAACGTAGASATGVTSGGPPLDLTGFGLIALAAAAGVLAIAAIAVMLLFTTGRAPQLAFSVPRGVPVSPDGYFWWDGSAWQPALTTAQR